MSFYAKPEINWNLYWEKLQGKKTASAHISQYSTDPFSLSQAFLWS